MATSRGFRDLGYGSLDAYAGDRLGMAPSRAKALLAIERACEVSPALRAGWREGRLSWSQAQELLPLVRLGHAERWMEAWGARAQEVTVRRLRDDVEAAVASERLDPAELAGGARSQPSFAEPRGCPDPRRAQGLRTGMLRTRACALRSRLPARPRPRSLSAGAAADRGVASGGPAGTGGPGDVPADRARGRGGLLPGRGGPGAEAARAPPRASVERVRGPGRHVRPRARGVDGAARGAERPRAAGAGDLRARRLALHGAGLYEPPRSPRPPRALPVGGGRRRAGEPDDPVRGAPLLRGVHRGTVRIRGRAPEGLRYELPVGRWRAGDVVLAP